MSLDNSVLFKIFWKECSNNDYLESSINSAGALKKNHRGVGKQHYSSEMNNSIRSLAQISFTINRSTLNKYRKYKFHFYK